LDSEDLIKYFELIKNSENNVLIIDTSYILIGNAGNEKL
jgi:hypothetical protein